MASATPAARPLSACHAPARLGSRCRGTRAGPSPRAVARSRGDRLGRGFFGAAPTRRAGEAARPGRLARSRSVGFGAPVGARFRANSFTEAPNDTPDRGTRTLDRSRATRAARGSVPLARLGRVAAATVAAVAAAAAFPGAAAAAASAASAADASFLASLLDFALHVDERLLALFAERGVLAYGALFAVIFCETGLVIAPFLPGDSLLFAAGALGAGGVLNFPFAACLLFCAAVLGDTVNYALGSWIGARVIARYPSVFKPSYIDKTKAFYQTHGGKTVVLARFFVVVRTFAPFVAGVANMQYKKFIAFNVLGGATWVGSFMGLGYFFGQLPWVEENFALAMAAVVALSAVPMAAELVKHVFGGKEEETASIEDVDATIDDIAGSFDEAERLPSS
jgi:membrane-associated protein